jgi:hypothetical protein
MLQRISFVASLVAVFALAGAAFAGNGAGSSKSLSSISGPVVVSFTAAPSGAAATAPRFGDTVTFSVSSNETSDPFVNLTCYQNGVLVENSWAAFWPTAGTFVLSSPAWSGGAADCKAELGGYVNSSKYKVYASTSFSVSG